jgi:hypothetical protein
VGSSVAVICAIPLPNVEAHDSLIWKHASNGKFSVSSTYQLAIRLKTEEGMIGSSCRETNKRVWKSIWKQGIPNKVKIHLWQACLNALPTLQCLSRRHLLPDSVCPICLSESETVTHALWASPHARTIWALIPSRIQKLHESINRFLPTDPTSVQISQPPGDGGVGNYLLVSDMLGIKLSMTQF